MSKIVEFYGMVSVPEDTDPTEVIAVLDGILRRELEPVVTGENNWALEDIGYMPPLPDLPGGEEDGKGMPNGLHRYLLPVAPGR